ncbi:MAG TPA: VOC family protein [Gaiellales bacterium]|nr:VOC family protein [Gaiellales bacterium]
MSGAARNPFGHIDLRVTSMNAALEFYEALLPELGFTQRFHGPVWKAWAAELELPAAAYLAITESASHRPGESRIAFWTASAEEVDRLAAIATEAGARDVSGPKPMPYSPGYYAVFFADPSGNLLEIYHRPPA